MAESGQAQQSDRDWGWRLNPSDNSLEYIVQISPEKAAYLQRSGQTLRSEVPPEVRARMSRVVFQFGNEQLPREPSLEELRRSPAPQSTSEAFEQPGNGLPQGNYAQIDSKRTPSVLNVAGGSEPPSLSPLLGSTIPASGSLSDSDANLVGDASAPVKPLPSLDTSLAQTSPSKFPSAALNGTSDYAGAGPSVPLPSSNAAPLPPVGNSGAMAGSLGASTTGYGLPNSPSTTTGGYGLGGNGYGQTSTANNATGYNTANNYNTTGGYNAGINVVTPSNVVSSTPLGGSGNLNAPLYGTGNSNSTYNSMGQPNYTGSTLSQQNFGNNGLYPNNSSSNYVSTVQQNPYRTTQGGVNPGSTYPGSTTSSTGYGLGSSTGYTGQNNNNYSMLNHYPSTGASTNWQDPVSSGGYGNTWSGYQQPSARVASNPTTYPSTQNPNYSTPENYVTMTSQGRTGQRLYTDPQRDPSSLDFQAEHATGPFGTRTDAILPIFFLVSLVVNLYLGLQIRKLYSRYRGMLINHRSQAV